MQEEESWRTSNEILVKGEGVMLQYLTSILMYVFNGLISGDLTVH